MKNSITLTLTPNDERVTLDKSEVRVVENLTGYSRVTLEDGNHMDVAEDVPTILELLKTRSS